MVAPPPQIQTLHVAVTAGDLALLDAEASRMREAAGGGRFSRAEVLRSVMRAALNPALVKGCANCGLARGGKKRK